jgi:hypothetical protein
MDCWGAQQEAFMRSLLLLAIAAALTTAIMALPAQAQPHRHHQARGVQGAYGAAGPAYVAPFPQGFGYFGDTDPDPQVREELMRDPPNDR